MVHHRSKNVSYESYPPSYTCPTPLFRASRTYSLVSDCDAIRDRSMNVTVSISPPTLCRSSECTHKLTAIITSSRRFLIYLCTRSNKFSLFSRLKCAPRVPSFETICCRRGMQMITPSSLGTDDRPRTLTTAEFKLNLELMELLCDSLPAVFKSMFNLQRYGLTLQEQISA